MVISETLEGNGRVLTCSDCGWTRYFAVPTAANGARAEHVDRCKGPRVKTGAAPRVARSVKWEDREGATWIDSM